MYGSRPRNDPHFSSCRPQNHSQLILGIEWHPRTMDQLSKTVSLCHSLEFFNGINLGSIWTGFFKALPPNRPFCVRQFNFFGQSSLYKNHECSHCFFLFLSFLPARSFFFSFPFPSLLWFWAYRAQKTITWKWNLETMPWIMRGFHL